MFSHELDSYISQRNYTLTPQEGLFVTDVKQHPQINHIKFDPYNGRHDIWTSDGWSWNVKIKQREC